jgi:hypothetical protein
MRASAAASLGLIATGLILLACDTSDGTIDPATPPSEPAFRPVAEVLLDRCGTLDCHGSKYRNMRLFGLGGSRRCMPYELAEERDRYGHVRRRAAAPSSLTGWPCRGYPVIRASCRPPVVVMQAL